MHRTNLDPADFGLNLATGIVLAASVSWAVATLFEPSMAVTAGAGVIVFLRFVIGRKGPQRLSEFGIAEFEPAPLGFIAEAVNAGKHVAPIEELPTVREMQEAVARHLQAATAAQAEERAAAPVGDVADELRQAIEDLRRSIA